MTRTGREGKFEMGQEVGVLRYSNACSGESDFLANNQDLIVCQIIKF